jgi:hypothetical protein
MESAISWIAWKTLCTGQAPESAAQIQENHNLAGSEKATFYRFPARSIQGRLRKR